MVMIVDNSHTECVLLSDPPFIKERKARRSTQQIIRDKVMNKQHYLVFL